MTTQSTNINDTFFDGVYKDVWRRLIHPGLSEAECDFVKEIAQLEKEDKVLDLMCGYGRHSLELARRGFRVTAVDNSADYIAEINRTAQTESLQVEAFAVSVLEAEISQQYKAAICMGNSFAFFNREDASFLLRKIATCLAQEGILLINSWMIAEIAIRHFREKDWYELDGYKYLMSNRFCFQPGRIESEHTIISDQGKVEIIHGVDYIFTLSELETMFAEAGLRTKGVYSTPRKKPFRIGDSTVYIVAEKI